MKSSRSITPVQDEFLERGLANLRIRYEAPALVDIFGFRRCMDKQRTHGEYSAPSYETFGDGA